MIPLLQAVLGDMISLMAVMAIIAGIAKLFQIATSLNEIKDVLIEIKRNTRDYSVPVSSEAEPYPSESPLHAGGSGSDAASLQAALLDPEP
ncbi:MAG TPA: hypothetical protein VN841_25375 [Bryobacteraceae bacterium]|nr:hypothetical protein [Bryobacteraceae bacterium]